MDFVIKVDTTDLKLREMSMDINQMVRDTIEEVVEKVFDESQLLVPVNTGALRDSGEIIEDEYSMDGTFTSAYVSYGEGLDYAVKVHEDLDMRHDEPTRAKYLEIPLIQNRKVLENLIRERLKVILNS